MPAAFHCAPSGAEHQQQGRETLCPPPPSPRPPCFSEKETNDQVRAGQRAPTLAQGRWSATCWGGACAWHWGPPPRSSQSGGLRNKKAPLYLSKAALFVKALQCPGKYSFPVGPTSSLGGHLLGPALPRASPCWRTCSQALLKVSCPRTTVCTFQKRRNEREFLEQVIFLKQKRPKIKLSYCDNHTILEPGSP